MNKYNEMSILVNSCDKYSDCWPVFFEILKKSWPNAKNYKIYLNTETKKYSNDYFDIKVLNALQNKSDKLYWGERLIDCINRIESNYILFLLEDFFFEERVNEDILDSAFNLISERKDIAAITLITVNDKKNVISKNENLCGFKIRDKKTFFKLNASPTIYDKRILLDYTLKTDSIWEWEYFGSIRTWNSSKHFLSKSEDTCNIFDYDIIHGGAIHRGKINDCVIKKISDIYPYINEINTLKLPYSTEKKENRFISIIKNKSKFLLNFFLSLYFKIKFELRKDKE